LASIRQGALGLASVLDRGGRVRGSGLWRSGRRAQALLRLCPWFGLRPYAASPSAESDVRAASDRALPCRSAGAGSAPRPWPRGASAERVWARSRQRGREAGVETGEGARAASHAACGGVQEAGWGLGRSWWRRRRDRGAGAARLSADRGVGWPGGGS